MIRGKLTFLLPCSQADRISYWDFPYNNFNYSYVDAAIAAGYCTLSYDRLGIGNSSHGEPLNEIQAALEIGALYQLTSQLRQGQFPGVAHAFTKVVHVGHSFGSGQTLGLAAMYPDASDAVVLTGFSTNTSFAPLFLAGGNFQTASTVQPLRFGSVDLAQAQMLIANSALAGYAAGIDLSALPASQNLPNGYLLSGNAEADQFLFLLQGYFDPMLAAYAEMTKQPVTLGELLTVSSAPAMNPFSKPVLVFTGREWPKFLPASISILLLTLCFQKMMYLFAAGTALPRETPACLRSSNRQRRCFPWSTPAISPRTCSRIRPTVSRCTTTPRPDTRSSRTSSPARGCHRRNGNCHGRHIYQGWCT